MTCIVGLVADGVVYIGADSAAVEYDSISARKDSKVFRNANTIMGFTSSFRMGQLLQYDLKVPEYNKKEDLFSYMVTSFIPEVQECFAYGGYKKIENEVDSGGTFLVGIEGRLFIIDEDFQVGEQINPFSAVGQGDHVALGAMCALSHTNFSPEVKIDIALNAAATYCTSVCGPFNTITL